MMIHSPLKFGIVSDVKPGYAKVYFEEDDIVTGWWPVITKTSLKDFESWPLNVKEHVACICDERLEEGVILGAIHSDPEPPEDGAGPGKFRKVFEDGTVLEYDKTLHKLTADVKGPVNIKALTIATIEAPVITLKGNVSVVGVLAAGAISLAALPGVDGANGKVQGDLNATGTIKADTDVMVGTKSLKNHTHSGVTTGSGISGPPVV
jgi:phage baseplate assembly protein V